MLALHLPLLGSLAMCMDACHWNDVTGPLRDDCLVEANIVIGHATRREALLELAAHGFPVQLHRRFDGADGFLNTVDNPARNTMIDYLAHRTSIER